MDNLHSDLKIELGDETNYNKHINKTNENLINSQSNSIHPEIEILYSKTPTITKPRYNISFSHQGNSNERPNNSYPIAPNNSCQNFGVNEKYENRSIAFLPNQIRDGSQCVNPSVQTNYHSSSTPLQMQLIRQNQQQHNQAHTQIRHSDSLQPTGRRTLTNPPYFITPLSKLTLPIQRIPITNAKSMYFRQTNDNSAVQINYQPRPIIKSFRPEISQNNQTIKIIPGNNPSTSQSILNFPTLKISDPASLNKNSNQLSQSLEKRKISIISAHQRKRVERVIIKSQHLERQELIKSGVSLFLASSWIEFKRLNKSIKQRKTIVEMARNIHKRIPLKRKLKYKDRAEQIIKKAIRKRQREVKLRIKRGIELRTNSIPDINLQNFQKWRSRISCAESSCLSKNLPRLYKDFSNPSSSTSLVIQNLKKSEICVMQRNEKSDLRQTSSSFKRDNFNMQVSPHALFQNESCANFNHTSLNDWIKNTDKQVLQHYVHKALILGWNPENYNTEKQVEKNCIKNVIISDKEIQIQTSEKSDHSYSSVEGEKVTRKKVPSKSPYLCSIAFQNSIAKSLFMISQFFLYRYHFSADIRSLSVEQVKSAIQNKWTQIQPEKKAPLLLQADKLWGQLQRTSNFQNFRSYYISLDNESLIIMREELVKYLTQPHYLMNFRSIPVCIMPPSLSQSQLNWMHVFISIVNEPIAEHLININLTHLITAPENVPLLKMERYSELSLLGYLIYAYNKRTSCEQQEIPSKWKSESPKTKGQFVEIAYFIKNAFRCLIGPSIDLHDLLQLGNPDISAKLITKSKYKKRQEYCFDIENNLEKRINKDQATEAASSVEHSIHIKDKFQLQNPGVSSQSHSEDNMLRKDESKIDFSLDMELKIEESPPDLSIDFIQNQNSSKIGSKSIVEIDRVENIEDSHSTATSYSNSRIAFTRRKVPNPEMTKLKNPKVIGAPQPLCKFGQIQKIENFY